MSGARSATGEAGRVASHHTDRRASERRALLPPDRYVVLNALLRIGAKPNDDDDIRLQKVLLVLSTLIMSSLAFGWGALYIYFDELIAGLIPLTYAVLSYVSLFLFAHLRRYRLFRTSQLLLSLLLPALLMLSLGGFVNSSGVILWSLSCPLGALLFANRRQALGWFAVYLALLVAGLLWEPYARPANNLPPDIVMMFLVMNITGVSFLTLALTYYFSSLKDRVLVLLADERKRTEDLLYNTLPRDIAERLKRGEYPIADAIGEATVLFADLVGFSTLTGKLGPRHLVETLDDLFSAFDELTEAHGLEKIKTIGDAYMVLSGRIQDSVKGGQEPAVQVVELARQMVAAVAQASTRLGFDLGIRIGIHTGHVIAGVIGISRYQFDVWGEAVNVASRMESSGLPGRIQVSETTYWRVRDRFTFEPRGATAVKGYGSLETYLVVPDDGMPGAAALVPRETAG